VIKRTFLAIGAVFILYVLWSLVSSALGLSGGEQKRAPGRRAPQSKPWNGGARQVFSTDFVRGRDQLTLAAVRYKHLDLPTATVTVNLTASGRGSARPRWLKSLVGYRPKSTLSYRPKISIRDNGALFAATVTFPKVPSEALGPTCADPSWADPDPFVLRAPRLPQGEIGVQISAPPAPAGHCLDDPRALAALKARQASEIVLRKVKVKGHKVYAFGTVNRPGTSRVFIKTKGKIRAHASVNGGRRLKLRFKLKKRGTYSLAVGYSRKHKKTYPARGRGRARIS
jgi:hypothetical protein